MSIYAYKGIDLVAEDGGVQLLKEGEVVYERDFTQELKALPPEQHDAFLIRQGVVLADEYLHGDLDSSTILESWE